PSGATMVQLADGRVLYWDALEGTENIAAGSTDSQGLPVSSVPDGGRLTVNDQSRLLTLTSSGPRWTTPSPADGGAHNTSFGEDLPLPPPLAATHYRYNNGSLFCADQVFLGNGQVLTTGGTDYYSEPSFPGTDKGFIELEGIRQTRVFVPTRDQWSRLASMNHGRWYPSLVTLGNGQVFVASGVTKLIKPLYPGHLADSGTNVRQTETFDPTVQPVGSWTDNGTSAERSLPLFPRLHLLPDGHVYYDAAGQAYNPAGQAYDELLWNVAGSYDPTTKTWADLGVPAIGTPFAGFRGSTFSAALELRPDASGGYTSASFLTAGGVLFPTPGSYVPVADSRIATVTTGAAGEQLSTVPTGALGRSRWYSTAVPLPDGTVYAASGADVDEVITPGYESPIRRAELFTPTVDGTGAYAGGSWRDAGDQARKRTYHNNALLLPDGSVLIGGHAPIPSGYHQTQDGTDLPGRPGTNNHHDASFQVWRPPYFADPNRPVVTGVHSPANGLVVVHTRDAAAITSVVLSRNTAQTHLVDGDARTVRLAIVARTADSVTAALPASSNVLPNGPYLLFANRGAGGDPAKDIPGQVLPSVGRQVFVVGTSVPVVVPLG
ncbi:MAG TPA: galactose oxidase-like domain-containing protein, partial [Acidimicrobiales bacterium]|nr:galactose oxidase-like domain-containing protein [Acidimicrobiales bacterium]